MAYVNWILVGAVGFIAFLWSGALDRPATPVCATPVADFAAQPITLASGAPAASFDGAALLRAACAAYQPSRVAWLQTTVWQKMTVGSLFESEGILQRGPGGCARLDMTTRTEGKTRHYLAVSDGLVVAQRTLHSDSTKEVESSPLADQHTGDLAQLEALRELRLREKGCAGPHGLLVELAQSLVNLQLDTGLRHGAPVYRVQGWLLPAVKTLPAIQVTIYFHPETLWPERLEYRYFGTTLATAPYLQIEYRDPIINQPLSRADCERAFTFNPAAQ